MYARADTPHRATSAMFYSPPLHFAEITLSRMTAAPAAIFWPTFQQSFSKIINDISDIYQRDIRKELYSMSLVNWNVL
jgi:hypothetical protein